MRSLIRPASALLAAAGLIAASPLPTGSDTSAYATDYLLPRDTCDGTPCGAEGQYCCGNNELCTTLSGDVATCLGGFGGAAYTSTWTETRTFTTTFFTNWAPVPAPSPGVDCVPQDDAQEACGSICCAGWQTCAFKGQCSVKPGYAEPTPVVITSAGEVETQYSAPYRVTGTTTITTHIVQTGTGTEGIWTGTYTVTQTGASSASSTSDSDAIGAGGSESDSHGGGLSGGAIAGIVIGTLAGIIEERYSKSGSRGASASAHSRRDRHGGWFGGSRAGASTVVAADRRREREKRKSSGGCWTWLGIGAVAATLFTLLNLKKDKRPNSRKAPSRYSESYYSYSDYTSNTASSSSGQRSRSRRSRSSRGGRSGRSPRSAQYSRAPKRP
ncbi:hypothetical protein BBK36DRAFT_1188968 [Trichoderma citrinoviride]|uniref:Uncharacterized protein n=1 Tax=Trichoderma citrinoviride TaxID=58853 RepID=A0A2T4BKT8_9HYPO|nr:hypothetical protein BBK36DRAFT_1188968 [Trichoderma citrinoviride]PTB69925.1 hypothetical protein BBK36DRAFT_1188968 [Trichoderma citrinoviride]